jgi:hypothetical protein
MLPLGHIGIRAERGDDRMSLFSKDEQYTLMTLWSIFRSPMMFGGHLPDNDPFTLSLLTNKDIMTMLNTSTNNRPLSRTSKTAVWTADDPKTGEKYLALFNLADPAEAVASKATWSSPVITKTTPGQSIRVDVDITGSQKLYLAVLDGGDDLAWDFADWIAPTVYKADGDSLVLTSLRPVRSVSGAGRMRNNMSAASAPLNIAGKVYPTGLGVAANSVIEYNLPEGYTRFRALAGVDKAAADQNTGCTVQFLVATQDPSGPPVADKMDVTFSLGDLGMSAAKVRELWSGATLGTVNGQLTVSIPKHGAKLFKLAKIK